VPRRAHLTSLAAGQVPRRARLTSLAAGQVPRRARLTSLAAGSVPRRARLTSLAAAVASALVLAALWAPWVRTGSTTRSAFGLVSALRGAGLMHGQAAEALFAAVAVVPGLAVATWVLWAARFRRASGAVAATAGAIVAAASLTVGAVAHATSALVWATVAALVALVLGTATLATPRRKAVT